MREDKDDSSTVCSCIKCIELNAVCAGTVESPAAYRYCSWGVWCGHGKRLYAGSETPMEEVIAAHESAKKEEPLLLRLDRPVRYWSEGR